MRLRSARLSITSPCKQLQCHQPAKHPSPWLGWAVGAPHSWGCQGCPGPTCVPACLLVAGAPDTREPMGTSTDTKAVMTRGSTEVDAHQQRPVMGQLANAGQLLSVKPLQTAGRSLSLSAQHSPMHHHTHTSTALAGNNGFF